MRFFNAVLGILLLAGIMPEEVHPFHEADSGSVRCLDCHVTLPLKSIKLTFHENITPICRQCHEHNHGEIGLKHPVEVTPSLSIEVPFDMPLDKAGKLTCITCHQYHSKNLSPLVLKTFLLRRPPGKTFCYYCHPRL